jgi:hypothetical protein
MRGGRAPTMDDGHTPAQSWRFRARGVNREQRGHEFIHEMAGPGVSALPRGAPERHRFELQAHAVEHQVSPGS